MVKINLLPHREETRKQRGKAFYALLVLGALVGVGIVIVGAGLLEGLMHRQEQRNNVLRQENKRLDGEIKKVATLKQEIESLRARQQAVEDLQGDRNQPVYLMDELVMQTPEGIYLKSLKQDGQRVVLVGYAQSNERVSEYLRNLGNNSQWLERPDLKEIKAVTLGQGKQAKRIFDFTVDVGIKRPRDKELVSSKVPGGATPVGGVQSATPVRSMAPSPVGAGATKH
ncbi:MAG: fimbrial assembly protein [Oxalobacter sp.]|nr:MAG: fimbrial assembly protein [Oxalobacter sp.]